MSALFRFAYPVTHPVNVPHFSLILFVLGWIWLTGITLFNIVALGYENVTITSTSFTADIRFWYDKFIPARAAKYLPENWNCNGSNIKLYDYKSICLQVMKDITTQRRGCFNYQLLQFFDPNPSGVNWLVYKDYPLQNCSVESIQLAVAVGPTVPIQDSVTSLLAMDLIIDICTMQYLRCPSRVLASEPFKPSLCN